MTIQLTPGTMTTSQRRAQLEETRFLDIRNLAYLTYKKADGSPLLTYEETLNDRDAVKLAVLQFEIASNALIPDGTEQQTRTSAVQPAVQNPGNTQMTTPFPQQPGQMPQQNFAAPPGVQAPPQFAPPQQQMQQPPQQQLPFAAPQNPFNGAPPAAPAAPQQGQPAQQPAPEAAPEGRKRRGRPPASAQGTAVAPPPAAPPATPEQQPPFAPPFQNVAAPAPQFAPQQAAQAPAFTAPPFSAPPAAPQGTPPPMFAQQAQPSAPPAAAGFNPGPAMQMAPAAQATADLSPVIGRLDDIGKMVSSLTGEIAVLKQQNAALTETINLLFIAGAHQYFTNPSLAAMLQQGNVQQNPAAFREYLKKYLTP